MTGVLRPFGETAPRTGGCSYFVTARSARCARRRVLIAGWAARRLPRDHAGGRSGADRVSRRRSGCSRAPRRALAADLLGVVVTPGRWRVGRPRLLGARARRSRGTGVVLARAGVSRRCASRSAGRSPWSTASLVGGSLFLVGLPIYLPLAGRGPRRVADRHAPEGSARRSRRADRPAGGGAARAVRSRRPGAGLRMPCCVTSLSPCRRPHAGARWSFTRSSRRRSTRSSSSSGR